MQVENLSIKFYEEAIALWKRAGIDVGSSDTLNEINIMINKNPDLCLIGKLDNKVIEVVMGGFDGRRGYIHHLAVDPDYQKRGYGRIMMNNLIEKFRQKGVHKVHLFIEKYNKEAVKFYLKLGWEIREDLIMMSYVPDKNLYKRKI